MSTKFLRMFYNFTVIEIYFKKTEMFINDFLLKRSLQIKFYKELAVIEYCELIQMDKIRIAFKCTLDKRL